MSLTGTDCSYSGIGNGGLAAGMTYYFKVRAGNQYGFGPFSQDVAVSMPVVTLKKSSPADNADDVSTGSVITAVLDQPVKITDVDKIQVYEKSTGSPVTKEQVEAVGTSVNITASLMKSTEYQIAFYDQALESEGNQGVYNRLFGRERRTGRLRSAESKLTALRQGALSPLPQALLSITDIYAANAAPA